MRPIGTTTKKMKISPITDFVFCEMGPLQKKGAAVTALSPSLSLTHFCETHARMSTTMHGRPSLDAQNPKKFRRRRD